MKNKRNKNIAIINIHSLFIENPEFEGLIPNLKAINYLSDFDEIHITNSGDRYQWPLADTILYSILKEALYHQKNIVLHQNHEFFFPPNYHDANKKRSQNANGYLGLIADIKQFHKFKG